MAKVVWGIVALSFGANLLELALFRLLMIIFGPGLNNLWLGGIMFLCLVCLLFAGQSGGREMLLSLKKKFIKHPCEIICSACAFMGFWAGLYPESMKEIIMAGADSMLKTALRILGSQRERVLLDDQEQEPFKHLLIR